MADSDTTNTPEAPPATMVSETTPANPTPAAPSVEAATPEPALSPSSALPVDTSSPDATTSTEVPTPAATPATVAAAPSAPATTSAGPTSPSALGWTNGQATQTVDETIDYIKKWIKDFDRIVATGSKVVFDDALATIKKLEKELEVLGGKIEVDLEALKSKLF